MSVSKKLAPLLTITLIGGAITVNPSYADSHEKSLIGSDRWETAVKISQNGWTKSNSVVIVNESSIADALCATPFAKSIDAPILLTQREKLDDRTKSEIKRLGAKKVYLIGGEGVLSKNIESQLKSSGITGVERISGSDRYQTSFKLAQKIDTKKDVTEVAIVNGNKGLADAVSVSSPAAQRNIPILLSESDSNSPTIERFVKDEGIKKSYVIGGEKAISNKLMDKLPNSIRLGGANRNETNAKVLEEFYKSTNLKNAYVTKDGIKGENQLIDALAVGVLAAKNESPVVIVSDILSDNQKKILNTKSFKNLTRVGGNGNEGAFNEFKSSQGAVNYTARDIKELEQVINKCDANDVITFRPRTEINNITIDNNASIKINIEENSKSLDLNVPNGEVTINGKVGSLTISKAAKLNIGNSGYIEEIKIKENSNGFEINNQGKIDNITNNAKNVRVINAGTIKNKPTGTQSVSIENNNISSNSSSIGSSSNVNTEKPQVPQVPQESSLINTEQSKIVDVEGTGYAVISLKKGNIDNTEFTLNGKTVKPTPVNTEGTIVKFEVVPNEKVDINLKQQNTSNKEKDSIIFNKNSKNYSRIINKENPDKILASGPISIYDYHQINYDKHRNIRVSPSKTTFNLGRKDYTNKNIPTLTSKRTRVGEDILINYDTSHKNADKWKENIHSVELVYLETGTTAKLEYSMEDGKIIINGKSTPIDERNGKHIVMIKSKGFDDIKVGIETVRGAGKINLSADFNFISNSELLFELEDFNYAIKNPVYEVLLDGEKLQGDCVEYHVLSNLLRLENDCKKKLSPGKHRLTVKAHGYDDFVKDFYLKKPQHGETNPERNDAKDTSIQDTNEINIRGKKSLDAISSASLSGGSAGSGGSQGGSGGPVIRANLIYDFDLLSNAMILRSIGHDTNESRSILSWWSRMTKDAILTNESDKVLSYKNYKNAMNSSLLNDEYMTFKEYYDKHKASDYKNKPYNIKYVLEDGLLGDIQSYSQENLKFAPNAHIKKEDGKIRITFDENCSEYINDISGLYVNENNVISSDKYEIKNNEIVINDISNFRFGINKVKILADGYKVNKLEIDMSKEGDKISLKRDNNSNVFVKLDSEFKKKIREIELNGKVLNSDSQLGGNRGDYYYDGNTLVIKSSLFVNTQSQYTLKINADGYKLGITTFIPDRLEIDKIDLKEVPNYVSMSQKNTYKESQRVLVTVEDNFNSDYKKNIKKVTLNGVDTQFNFGKDDISTIEIYGINFKKTGVYKLCIESEGYVDFINDINIQKETIDSPDVGDLVEGDDTPNAKDVPEIKVSKDTVFRYHIFETEPSYIESVNDIKVNDVSLNPMEWTKSENKIQLNKALSSGDKVKILSNVYGEYNYFVPKKSLNKVDINKNKSGNYEFSNRDYEWSDDIEILLNERVLQKEKGYKAENGKIEILEKLSVGDNLEIKSSKYEDYSYKVALLENNVKMNNNFFSKKYSFNSSDSWRDSIKSVKVNGEVLDKAKSSFDDKGYVNNYSGGIDILNTLSKGDRIEIESDGYVTYSVVI